MCTRWKDVPEKLRAFLPYNFQPTPAAIKAFHDITGRGAKGIVFLPDRQDNITLGDLIQAHTSASREWSEVLDGLWAKGLWGIGPQKSLLLRDEIKDFFNAGANDADWIRRIPLWERMCRLTPRLDWWQI